MKIFTLVLGELENNCYILIKDNKMLIIDPSTDTEEYEKYLNKYELEGILITHYHFDHIGGLDNLVKKTNIKPNDFKNIKTFQFETIKTPGHTSDSISFYFKEEKVLFSGDFIFKNTIGRMDLPTGDKNEMLKSLKNIENKIIEDVKIYPGHGPETTMYEEKYNFTNYYQYLL